MNEREPKNGSKLNPNKTCVGVMRMNDVRNAFSSNKANTIVSKLGKVLPKGFLFQVTRTSAFHANDAHFVIDLLDRHRVIGGNLFVSNESGEEIDLCHFRMSGKCSREL